MAVMGDSKGGGNLAQSFMNNTATQAPQQLPAISAPQGFSTPQPAMPPQPAPQAPVMGSMAPRQIQNPRYNPGNGLRDGNPAMFETNGDPIPRFIDAPPPAPVAQPAPQPTRYQLIAQAINDRAAARLNNRGS